MKRGLVAITFTVLALGSINIVNAAEEQTPITPYGYIKLDMAYDSARTSTGNFARWVESEAANDNDDELNVTANQSRFGLKFKGHKMGTADTGAKVEVDFYGGGAENKSLIMLRHAYMQMKWPEQDVTVIAGQTSDVISPLVPTTVNYSVCWWAGNIGYRRPQLRVEKGVDMGGGHKLTLQLALSRTIGHDSGFGPGDAGEDSAMPTFQSRAAWSFGSRDKTATIGLSGHSGIEEYDLDAAGTDEKFASNSFNIDVSLPIVEKVSMKAEYYGGKNTDAYLGGIAQGLNVTTLKEIDSQGGWAAVNFGPFEKWEFNVGYSVDDPEDGDLDNGSRSKNTSVFGNTFATLNESIRLGLELSQWTTEYKAAEDGDSFRAQTTCIYSF